MRDEITIDLGQDLELNLHLMQGEKVQYFVIGQMVGRSVLLVGEI